MLHSSQRGLRAAILPSLQSLHCGVHLGASSTALPFAALQCSTHARRIRPAHRAVSALHTLAMHLQ